VESGGTIGPSFLNNDCATQPVQQDLQAKGVNRLHNFLQIQASNTRRHGPWVTLQEDCNGAGPILAVPKTNKDRFLGLGCCISYRTVWSSDAKMKEIKKWSQKCPLTLQGFWDMLYYPAKQI
jgi:hypothetical protein